MIKIFRKIRQKLLAENRFSKYLIYAIGEIILVVIGILIALQINTWNEKNKTKELEVKILKEIHSNLSLDLKELQHDISSMDSIVKACKYIKAHLKTQDKPDSTFNYNTTILRVIPHFDPNKSGYGLLQSKGVEVISNDSLRNNISILYEQAYTYYRRYEDERLDFFNFNSQPKLLDYFYRNFDTGTTWFASYFITQEDYEKLRIDESFSKLLSAIAFENASVQHRAKRTEKHIINLLQFIEEELN
jgi:cell division protein FtsL